MNRANHNNTLWTRDNLEVLQGLNSDYFDLIYLDPPFNSKRLYSAPIGSKAAGVAFKDTWTWNDVDESCLERLVTNYPSVVHVIEGTQAINKSMAAYLTYMAQRIIEMYRVLKSDGSIYLHCDQTASHYLKAVMDGIFGIDNFRNEIIWERDPAGRGAKKTSSQWPRNIDIILFYSKSSDIYFKQIMTTKFEHKTLKEFRYSDPDGRRFKIVTLGDYSQNSIEEMRGKNLIYTTSKGTEYKKYYLDEFQLAIGSVWNDIPNLSHGKNPEQLGYPTQKPIALLRRIIEASTKEGDTILDPFCGCATACVAAQQLQRNWIGIDIEEQATKILVDRLKNDAGMFTDFIHRTDVPQRTDVKIEAASSKSVKDRLFENQNKCCAGCGNSFNIQNLEVDHIIPRAKGGGDYFDNYQLLCGNCNRIKGDRPMDYLRTKIKVRDAMWKTISFGAS